MKSAKKLLRKLGMEEQVEEGAEDEAVQELLAAGVMERDGAREAVVDKEGLLDALGGFERGDLGFLERLDVTSHAPLSVANAEDDLQRELALCVRGREWGAGAEGVRGGAGRACVGGGVWGEGSARSYTQALAAVKTSRRELERLGEPHRRPDDYMAEMVKSDEHMRRIRGKLLDEQRRMEAVERRQRESQSRKFAKQVQAERAQQSAREKKAAVEAVKQWRKKRELHGDNAGAEGAAGGERGGPSDAGRGRGGSEARPHRGSSPAAARGPTGRADRAAAALSEAVERGQRELEGMLQRKERRPWEARGGRRGRDEGREDQAAAGGGAGWKRGRSPSPGRPGSGGRGGAGAPGAPGAKRRAKDAKFGFGGRKRGTKENGSEFRRRSSSAPRGRK